MFACVIFDIACLAGKKMYMRIICCPCSCETLLASALWNAMHHLPRIWYACVLHLNTTIQTIQNNFYRLFFPSQASRDIVSRAMTMEIKVCSNINCFNT